MLSVNGLLVHVNKQNEVKLVSKVQMCVTNKIEEIDPLMSCRVCLKKEELANLFCLFGANKMFNDFSIASALLECFGVELKHESEYPNCVCVQCASMTLQCYTFKKCLEKCQGYLREWKMDKNGEDCNSKIEMVSPVEKIPNILYDLLNRPSDIPEESVVTTKKKPNKYLKKQTKRSKNTDFEHLLEHNYHKKVTSNENGLSVSDEDDSNMKVDDGLQLQREDAKESNKSSSANSAQKDELQDADWWLKQLGTFDCDNDVLSISSSDNAEEELEELNGDAKSENDQIEKDVKESEVKKNFENEKWYSRHLGPPYDCKICGCSFGVRYRTFYGHVRKHYMIQTPCTFCSKRFTRSKMVVHMRTHTKEKPFICDRCPARFTIESNLKRHISIHTGEKSYICDVCGKTFNQSSSLKTHKQIHSADSCNICPYCGKIIRSSSRYRMHIYMFHNKNRSNQNKEGSNPHKCSICGRSFLKEQGLKLHFQVHKNVPTVRSNSKNQTCKLCFKRCNSYHNLRIHTILHELQTADDAQDTWACEFCDEVYTEKKILKMHLRTHMHRPFLCDVCERGFASKGALQTHARGHTDIKPYSCSSCDKVFAYYNNLKQHQMVHTGEKPHKCDVCSRSFSQQQQLMSHMYTHTGEKKYICPYCGKAFALNGNLTVHKRRHTGETPYVCDVCKKGFYDSSSLKKHKVGRHKNSTVKDDVVNMKEELEAVQSLLAEDLFEPQI